MTVYFQASEMDGILGGLYHDENAGHLDAAGYARAGVIASSTIHCIADAGQELTTFWFRAHWRTANSGGWFGGNPCFYFNDANGADFVRLSAQPVADCLTVQYYNGTSWVNLGSAIYFGVANVSLTVRLKKGSPDQIQVWVDDALVFDESGEGILSESTGWQQVEFSGTNRNATWSEVIIADESLVDWHLWTVPATADGSDTDGTGDYTNVNAVALDDTTGVILDSAEQHSFTGDGLTISGYGRVLSVGGAWFREDESSPSQVKPYLKISGTRYYGDTFDLEVGLNRLQYTWNLNPATGVFWLTAALEDSALEWGWEVV